jgi:hypothetical protein
MYMLMYSEQHILKIGNLVILFIISNNNCVHSFMKHKDHMVCPVM